MFKLILPLLFVTGFAVIPARDEVVIDNPSSEKIIVKVDDQKIVLEKGVSKTLALSEGGHLMKFKDSSFPFTFKKGEKLLINPTRAIYVIDKTFYTRSGGDILARPSNDKIKEMFIKGEWNYNLTDVAPGPMEVSPLMKNVSQMKVIKIYRGRDFWYGNDTNALGEKRQ